MHKALPEQSFCPGKRAPHPGLTQCFKARAGEPKRSGKGETTIVRVTARQAFAFCLMTSAQLLALGQSRGWSVHAWHA